MNPENERAQGEGRKDPAQLVLARWELLIKGLSLGGWGILFTLGLGGAMETIRFFSPSVVFRPPSTFQVGKVEDFVAAASPDDYGVILVDAKWKKDHRFFILREPTRLYALYARCTHLGCTINWFPSLNVFKCPCHGSQFYSNGVSFAGPAPRSLDFLRTFLNDHGNIVVDTRVAYSRERFEKTKAYIAL